MASCYGVRGIKQRETCRCREIIGVRVVTVAPCVFALQTVTPLGFRVGMKLEAVDKKKPSLVRVSTVRDMVESRLLVHFDSWDESYDYW